MAFQQSPTKATKAGLSATVVCAYAISAAIGLGVFYTVAEGEVSSVLTLSALAQCLGITMLIIQSLSGSAAGISAKSLVLDAVAIALRLSSTLWLDGYLPSDSSGDYVYQTFDVCALLMLMFLLHRVLVKQRDTYQYSDDTMRIGSLVFVCLSLGAVLHGDMDDNALFDTTWLAGLFTSVVAVLPQLWLITSTGGSAGALTSHYIAAMALSRFLSGYFMWIGRYHLSCAPYFGAIQHTCYAILIAHFVHVVLLGDFAYHYVRGLVRGGIYETMQFNYEV